MQANESLQQELSGRPGAVSEALAISEDIPPPSSPAAKRAALEVNGGGPSGKRCVPVLHISALLLVWLFSHPTNTFVPAADFEH